MDEKKKNDPTAWIVIGSLVVLFIILIGFVIIKVVLPDMGRNNDNFGPPIEMQPEPNPDEPPPVEAQPEPNPEEP